MLVIDWNVMKFFRISYKCIFLLVVVLLVCFTPARGNADEYQDSLSLIDAAVGRVSNEWIESQGNRYYVDERGSIYTGELLYRGHWYYLNPYSSGAMAVGIVTLPSGKTVYYDPATGQMQYAFQDIPDVGRVYLDPISGALTRGERRIESKWYYFYSNGAMATGFVSLPSGKTVYYGDDGAMVYGSVTIPGYGNRIFDPVSGALRTGWNSFDDKKYYIGSDGHPITGELRIDGRWYYLDPEHGGIMSTGFVSLPSGKTVYYGPDGSMLYGEQKISGNWFFFDLTSGARAVGMTRLPYGKTVYYDSAGIMQYGLTDVGKGICWFNTCDGSLLKGGWASTSVDGKTFFADESGAVLGYGTTHSNDAVELCDLTGSPLSGWVSLGSKKMYAEPGSGIMARGKKQIGNEWYWFNSDNGLTSSGEQRIGDSWYLFDSDGRMLTGFQNLPSKKVYYDISGKMLYGQQCIGGYWYYFDTSTGSMLTGWMFIRVQDKWVYYGSDDGRMVHGVQQVDGRTIYYDNSTGAMTPYSSVRGLRVAAEAARRDTYGYSGGWCQAWVCTAYERAGESGDTRPAAYGAMLSWRVSSSRGGIPVGATVYAKSVSGSHGWSGGIYYPDYGHVGIYIGHGQVASLMYGSIWIEPVENWTGSDRWLGWGWNGGIPLV